MCAHPVRNVVEAFLPHQCLVRRRARLVTCSDSGAGDEDDKHFTADEDGKVTVSSVIGDGSRRVSYARSSGSRSNNIGSRSGSSSEQSWVGVGVSGGRSVVVSGGRWPCVAQQTKH